MDWIQKLPSCKSFVFFFFLFLILFLSYRYSSFILFYIPWIPKFSSFFFILFFLIAMYLPQLCRIIQEYEIKKDPNEYFEYQYVKNRMDIHSFEKKDSKKHRKKKKRSEMDIT